MSSDYSILQCAVFDFSESVCTVSQVLNTYVREVEAGSGEDFVQVTTEEYGRLNIFRALVEFDTSGHLRLTRSGCGVDDNFLAPLSSFQDDTTIAGWLVFTGRIIPAVSSMPPREVLEGFTSSPVKSWKMIQSMSIECRTSIPLPPISSKDSNHDSGTFLPLRSCL